MKKNKNSFFKKSLDDLMNELHNIAVSKKYCVFDISLLKYLCQALQDWRKIKHQFSLSFETSFINSIEVKQCPYCKSNHILCNGSRADGIKTYKCYDCKKKFNPLSNSVLGDRKLAIFQRIEFMLGLYIFNSVSSTAEMNRNVKIRAITG